MNPTVGVCIATHNRREDLARTLHALARLDPQPDEVIVLADGCTDGTAEFVAQSFPTVRRLEHAEAQGSVPSRNEAAAACRSEIVLSLDDDSYPIESDFIPRVARFFAENPALAVLSFPQRTNEFPETLTKADFGPSHFIGSYANSGAAIRHSVFTTLGAYPEFFRHAYEEPDFALRCVAAGWQVRQETSLTIRHHYTSAQRNELRMHQQHARNEQWSVLLRCPAPYFLAVALFRLLRQAGYARRRGVSWLLREPVWWCDCLRGAPARLPERKPLPWRKYRAWMELVRHPIYSEEEWVAKFGQTGKMKISFAATNPCHIYPFAVELAKRGLLGVYYSGYPAWKLADSAGLPLRTYSLRTNLVYGLIKFIPERFRPSSRALYLWQDHGFDRWVGAHLEPCDFIHGLPGQCVHTFRAARRLGIRTVLNHATGPVREWVRIMEPEYSRVGLRVSDICAYDEAYFRREEEEYALADFHCAASTVVRDQLVAQGIEPERVWLVPYGADTRIFQRDGTTAPEKFRIVFAGMLGLRKGLRTLLAALTLANRQDWRMDFYGLVLGEARTDLNAYRGITSLHFHGAVSQTELACAFRAASVLVLPSLEEGFGLVVPQALNCGCPVIVSDRVGAKDLVQHRENGSVVPVGNTEALAQELLWHAQHPRRTADVWEWNSPVKLLLGKSKSATGAM